jgi:hypothetical protein
MQSSSSTFSTPTTVTVLIFSCKVIKKRIFKYMYNTAGHRQKCQTKHNPQQAAKSQPTEAPPQKNTTLGKLYDKH